MWFRHNEPHWSRKNLKKIKKIDKKKKKQKEKKKNKKTQKKKKKKKPNYLSLGRILAIITLNCNHNEVLCYS